MLGLPDHSGGALAKPYPVQAASGPRGGRPCPPVAMTGSHTKLGWIANMEPIETILHCIQIRWAAKACRTADPLIKGLLQDTSTEPFPPWHFAPTPLLTQLKSATTFPQPLAGYVTWS